MNFREKKSQANFFDLKNIGNKENVKNEFFDILKFSFNFKITK